MGEMELVDALDAVVDLPTFLIFAKRLQADWEVAIANERMRPSSPYDSEYGWENTSIEDFLESAIAWAESTNCGENQGLSPGNPWKQFATFLYCGKIYE